MQMSRRALLTGVAALAVAPALPKVPIGASLGPVLIEEEVEDLYLEGMSQTIAADLFYGVKQSQWLVSWGPRSVYDVFPESA